MWAVSLIQPRPILPFITKPTKPPLIPLTLTVSANSHPHNGAVSSENIGALGHTLISALNSSPSTPNPNPIPIPKQQNEKQEGKQISGSDVLWALQRAATQKNKKHKKKRRESSSADSNRQEDAVDYSNVNVRPLRIKSEWGVRLNDLEKRLQDLSEIT